MGGGSRSSTVATWPRAPTARSAPSKLATAPGLSRSAWAAVAVQHRGDLAGGPHRAQRAQQAGHSARVVEIGVGGSPVGWALIVGMQRVQEENEAGPRTGIAMGAGLLVQAGCVAVQAAVVGGVAELGLVGGRGVRGGGGPELGRGDLAGALRPAILVQIVREPVQRPAAAAMALGWSPR